MATKDSTPPAKKAAAKKTAAKKAPAKKAPKKKVAELQLEDPSKLKPIVFKRRFGATDADRAKVLGKMTANVRKSIQVLNERSAKRPVKLLTPAMLRRALIPYEEISFQYMLNSIGFRAGVAIEIVAQEKVGATTFVMDCISRLLDMGCYSSYIECENKQMDDKRIKRLMDRDPRIATLKLNSVMWAEARTLAQCDETIRKTTKDLRKRCDSDPSTKGNPIFIFIDPWGALMSDGEAKGNSDWGLDANAKAKAETPKDSAAGSNFEHAKHASRMARWLPAFMETNNAVVVFVNKQNDKVDMVSKPRPGFLLAPSPSKNDTRVGGRALKRLCGYRLTMLKLDDIRKKDGDKKVLGHNVRMMLVANSYGPRDRVSEFTIYFDGHEDTPDYQAPGFTYDPRTAAWLVKNKFLGITVKDGLYTCDLVGCVAVEADELMAALRNHPEHLEYVGSHLGIEGYPPAASLVTVVDEHVEKQEIEEDESEDEPELPDMLVPGDDASEEVPDAS